MKKNYIVFVLSMLFAGGIVQNACQRPEECLFLGDEIFGFKLVDRFKINQIAAWGSRYDSKLVTLTKSDGTLANHLFDNGDGDFSFLIPEISDELHQDSVMTRLFFLNLPDSKGQPNQDTDTLKFTYGVKDRCYNIFQVWYNDSLYHSGSYIDFALFIKKD